MIEAPPLSREIAAIDIGSNSVRLVLYRLEGRAIWTVFNEKVLAGLGRDLASTGRLSPAFTIPREIPSNSGNRRRPPSLRSLPPRRAGR